MNIFFRFRISLYLISFPFISFSQLDSIEVYSLPPNSKYYFAITPEYLIEKEIESSYCKILKRRILRRVECIVSKLRVKEGVSKDYWGNCDARLLCILHKGEDIQYFIINSNNQWYYENALRTKNKRILRLITIGCEKAR
jgi:hypothetical protein